MTYRERVLFRDPLCYWKLESANSENLGSFEPGLFVNYTNNTNFNFDFAGVEGEDSCMRMDYGTYLSIGNCGFTPSSLWKNFSMEFFVKLDYEHCKNTRLPIVWKDFEDDPSYISNGYGMAVYMTPTADKTVFLEVYLFDDNQNPAFYNYIPAKEDQEWYQVTLVTELVNDDQQYLHSIYIDQVLLSYVLKPVRTAKPQFGDQHFWFNNSINLFSSTIPIPGGWKGYVDEVSVYDRVLNDIEITELEKPDVPDVFEYTPTAPGLADKIIIDGIHYDFTPSDWQDMVDDFKPVTASQPILDLNRVIIKQSKYESSFGSINHRKLLRQEWQVTWQSKAWTDRFMRDHLSNLYTLQRSFWLQYDDEMSRVCVRLFNVADNYRVYYTPTYPIAPYGYDPKNNRGKRHRRNVFVNGAPTSAFNVDEESGAVVFNDDLLSTDLVTMNYTWRCRVRIKAFNLVPSNEMPDVYVGTVTFEQVEANAKDDHWTVTYPDEDDIPYESGPSNGSCATPAALAMTYNYSDPNTTMGVVTDTSNSSDVSQGYDLPAFGVHDTGWNTFKYYDSIKAYNSLETMYECVWDIGDATNMAVFGCDRSLRTDSGIVPRYEDAKEFYDEPNDGDYYTFETQFAAFFFPYELQDIPITSRIIGVEFQVEYEVGKFRLDYFESETDETMILDALDFIVVPIVDGMIQNNEAQDRALDYTLAHGVGAVEPVFFESVSRETVTYGGSTDLWNRDWTVEELKGNFGVAIKARVSIHKDFFTPGIKNSVVNRLPVKIWCAKHKIWYVQ